MKLSPRTFPIIPEGTHVFMIDAVEYNEEFGKMNVSMHVQSGMKFIERYSLLKQDKEVNSGAMNAFSYFARCALNDFDVDDIDPQSLVGHYIKAEVTHEKTTNADGEERTYARLGKKYPAEGFEGEEAPEPAATESVDLNALLGL